MLLDQESKEDIRPWNMDTNSFCMLMHLSQFASSVFPLAGIIMPIVMWQQFKKDSSVIHENGKQIMNFMLTTFLVGIVFTLGIVAVVMTLYANASTNQREAAFSAMGIVTILLFAAGFSIAYVVFIILAAIKAYNGQVGKYPLTIRFIR
ncbi:MAG: DUF4870 domain-containing protein [Flavobacteriales bacterium]|jgi:uncharacterized Tic20 family protein